MNSYFLVKPPQPASLAVSGAILAGGKHHVGISATHALSTKTTSEKTCSKRTSIEVCLGLAPCRLVCLRQFIGGECLHALIDGVDEAKANAKIIGKRLSVRHVRLRKLGQSPGSLLPGLSDLVIIVECQHGDSETNIRLLQERKPT